MKKNSFFVLCYKEFIREKKKGIILLIIVIGVAVIFSNINPLLYGKMIDSISESNINNLIYLSLCYFFISILGTAASLLEGYVGQKLTFEVSSNIRVKLFQKIVGMKNQKINEYSVGELTSRLNNDAGSVVDYYFELLTGLIQIIISMCISTYFIIKISIHLSSVVLFYIPTSLAVTMLFRKIFEKLSKEGKKLEDKYSSYQTEVFSNIEGIKAFSMEKSVIFYFKEFIIRQFKFMKKSYMRQGNLQILNTTITIVSSLFILILSSFLIRDGLLSLGLMISFNTYVNTLFSTVAELFSLNLSKQSVNVSLNRIYTVLNYEDEYVGDSEKRCLSNVNSILFSNVCFSYDKNDNVISHLSFSIEKNGLYGIIGKNGCGKSTIAKLLIQLYQQNSGDILINGENAIEIKLEDIRKNILYISRNDFLWNTTIENNIKIANVDASLNEIKSICFQLGLDSDVMKLPKEYQTIIGENGNILSSGQKQKIYIARALLSKAKVLILDEITSNLDGASEHDIISVLKNMSKNKIIIIISHRVAPVMACDWIYLIKKGSLIASDTPNHLLVDNIDFQNLLLPQSLERT